MTNPPGFDPGNPNQTTTMHQPRFTPPSAVQKAPKDPEVRLATIMHMFPDATPYGDCGVTLECPGVHFHTVGGPVYRPGDCVIKLDDFHETPRLHCSHTGGCVDVVAEKRKELNRAIYINEMTAAGLWRDWMLTGVLKKKSNPNNPLKLDPAGQVAEAVKKETAKAIESLAERARLAQPLAGNVDPETPLGRQTRMQLEALYSPEDCVWFGTATAGFPTPVADILDLIDKGALQSFIGMARYPRTAAQRLNSLMIDSPWLVLEADTPVDGIPGSEWTLRLATCLLEDGIPPRVIVDSGGKSIHVWVSRAAYLARYAFGVTNHERNEMHRDILRVDHATLGTGQPVRLAGHQGEGRKLPATLLYVQP